MSEAVSPPAEDTVKFRTGELFIIMAHLTNAVIKQGEAINHLALRSNGKAAVHATEEASKQLDAIIEIYNQKLATSDDQ